MFTADDVVAALRLHATPERASSSVRYFQAFAGGYAEGDAFLGVTVPDTRRVAREFLPVSIDVLRTLLGSPWHEARLVALHIMVARYERLQRGAPDATVQRDALATMYLDARAGIDNWDLVDSSAWQVLGAHLRAGGTPRLPPDLDARPSSADDALPTVLAVLAAAPRSWDRRIAMVATFAWTRAGEAGPALRVAATLHRDPDDLVLKAVGWQLREVGQRCGREQLDGFLERHAATMGRVALRAAIEHHDEAERSAWRARR